MAIIVNDHKLVRELWNFTLNNNSLSRSLENVGTVKQLPSKPKSFALTLLS
jgi:hypothetical protein